jgi:hypothetical protein
LSKSLDYGSTKGKNDPIANLFNEHYRREDIRKVNTRTYVRDLRRQIDAKSHRR